MFALYVDRKYAQGILSRHSYLSKFCLRDGIKDNVPSFALKSLVILKFKTKLARWACTKFPVVIGENSVARNSAEIEMNQ